MNQVNIPDTKTRENGIKYHEKIVTCYQTLVTLLRDEVANPKLTPLEKARLDLELMQHEDTLKFKQQAYNIYAERVQAWQKQEEEAIADCNANFDSILQKAKQLTGNKDVELLLKVVEGNAQRVAEDARYKLNIFQQLMALIIKNTNKKPMQRV